MFDARFSWATILTIVVPLFSGSIAHEVYQWGVISKQQQIISEMSTRIEVQQVISLRYKEDLSDIRVSQREINEKLDRLIRSNTSLPSKSLLER